MVIGGLLLFVFGWWLGAPAGPPAPTALRFEVSGARGLLTAPQDGRVLVVLGKQARPEPRLSVGTTGMSVPPFLGRDAKAFQPGVTVTLDRSAALYPLADLSRLPKGEYHVQAVFDYNRDLRLPDAPGDLVIDTRRNLVRQHGVTHAAPVRGGRGEAGADPKTAERESAARHGNPKVHPPPLGEADPFLRPPDLPPPRSYPPPRARQGAAPPVPT